MTRTLSIALAFVVTANNLAAHLPLKFDLGTGRVEKGWIGVDRDTSYTAARGYGWTQATDLASRDRTEPDMVRRDFLFGRAMATFRADLRPGRYKVTLISGDFTHGDHTLKPRISGATDDLPQLHNSPGTFAVLATTIENRDDQISIELASPNRNWVLNAVTIEETTEPTGTKLTRDSFVDRIRTSWDDVKEWPDPIAPYVQEFRARAKHTPQHNPTGLSRKDYLEVIRGNVEFYLQHQDAQGAIIDPVRKIEFQYSTPCFALAGAALIEYAGRKDLVEPVAKATDWATWCLANKKGATAHDDFYAPVLAHALPLLKKHVDGNRYAKWEDHIRSFDPYWVYRSGPGGGNWNVVALSGEWLFHQMGLRKDVGYIEDSLRAQARFFSSPWGMYTEGPMPYDHFPRLWAANMLAHDYDGPWHKELGEVIRRGALTSLFMQSPWGELPAGGRSAHHQWNEAEQCVTYEIYAKNAKADGDPLLASTFKRAAHLALSSIRRWIRPSGEMWIVKNRMEPPTQHGFEGYSSHSQYNLLPMAMLAIAYEHAGATEDVAEGVCPAEIGGFVIEIQPVFNKVFANAGGEYVELDTRADHHYNPTGLLRVHSAGVEPALGPSDGLTSGAVFLPREAPRTMAAVAGIGWKRPDGEWLQLADLSGKQITSVTVASSGATSESAGFTVTYDGEFDGPRQVIEHYLIRPGQVEISAELPGYQGPVQMTWPVLVDDGKTSPVVEVRGSSMRTRMAMNWRVFEMPGSQGISVGDGEFLHRNGWSRIARAEWVQGPARSIIRTEAMK